MGVSDQRILAQAQTTKITAAVSKEDTKAMSRPTRAMRRRIRSKMALGA
jgi:hypothetical protein